MIRIRSAVPAILYVLLIVGLHLVLIEYLGIRIEGSATELRKEIGKVYFLPLLLCIINSFMLTKIRRIKYRVTWFLVTVIPSYLLLLFLKAIQDVEDNDYGVVVPIEFFPKYYAEMLILLPWSILIIQFILAVYLLITIRIDAKRSKIDTEA